MLREHDVYGREVGTCERECGQMFNSHAADFTEIRTAQLVVSSDASPNVNTFVDATEVSSYAAATGRIGVAVTVKLSIASGCEIVHESAITPSRAWTRASVAGATGYRHTPPMSAVLPVHAAHTVRLADDPSPAAHGVHEGEPAEAEMLPGGHTAHASPDNDDEPAGHAAHVGSPGPSVTHPPAAGTKLTVNRTVGEVALDA